MQIRRGAGVVVEIEDMKRCNTAAAVTVRLKTRMIAMIRQNNMNIIYHEGVLGKKIMIARLDRHKYCFGLKKQGNHLKSKKKKTNNNKTHKNHPKGQKV